MLIDSVRGNVEMPHQQGVRALVENHPQQWKLQKTFPLSGGREGELILYSRTGAEHLRIQRIEVDFTRVLKRKLTPNAPVHRALSLHDAPPSRCLPHGSLRGHGTGEQPDSVFASGLGKRMANGLRRTCPL